MKDSFLQILSSLCYTTHWTSKWTKIPIKYQSELSNPYISLKLIKFSLYTMYVYQYTMIWLYSMYIMIYPIGFIFY